MEEIFLNTPTSTTGRPIFLENEVVLTQINDFKVYCESRKIEIESIYVTNHRLIFTCSKTCTTTNSFHINISHVCNISKEVGNINIEEFLYFWSSFPTGAASSFSDFLVRNLQDQNTNYEMYWVWCFFIYNRMHFL